MHLAEHIIVVASRKSRHDNGVVLMIHNLEGLPVPCCATCEHVCLIKKGFVKPCDQASQAQYSPPLWVNIVIKDIKITRKCYNSNPKK